ncbi:GNAT family N-acetyltransferase [Microvirga sp. BT689]|uniref:GNAT family N-acetyltransferase n=1 Tax=Microvirga arvi TaxID=2778731 RepID=UPI0019506165|nr:GNAT family N-acetyltransferase [Microvirga arvi]MBM6584247.1 GNAT family N-acetyltransferase [Microvirga arvi]
MNFHLALGKDHIRTSTVRDFDALASHVPAWDRLASKASQQVPTLLPGWVDAFLHHRLRPNESWFCSFVYAGDELIGVLPVIVTPHPIMGRRWPLLRTPFDDYTRSGDIALTADQPDLALHGLLAEVRREEPRHLRLDLHAVRQNSPIWSALKKMPSGYVMRFGCVRTCSFLDVRGDFASFLSNFGHMGRNLRRFRKKLEKLGHVSIEIRRGSDAGEDLLLEFLALEASGWKGRNGTAILNHADVTGFYTSLVRNLSARGNLEWHVIRLGERLVAAQMAVLCGTSLFLLCYAFDEDFADCRPGTLLTEVTFREGFSRPEIDEVNPMSDFETHRIWHMPRDKYVDAYIIRRSVLPVLLQLPQFVYQNHVRPRIPEVVMKAYRKFGRDRYHKPRRASEAARLRQE